jgi:hypothetical protein
MSFAGKREQAKAALMAGGVMDEVVKDPVTRVLLQHEERIRSLETYFHIGVGIAAAGVTLLGAILGVLLYHI